MSNILCTKSSDVNIIKVGLIQGQTVPSPNLCSSFRPPLISRHGDRTLLPGGGVKSLVFPGGGIASSSPISPRFSFITCALR